MRERSTTPTSSGDRQNASPSRNDLPSGSGQKSLDRERHGSGWQKKNFLFIHPNLGIGGAERLVVDAAVGLQELGHNVTIYTSYCNRNHCFEEVRIGGSHPELAVFRLLSILSQLTISRREGFVSGLNEVSQPASV